MVGEIRVLCYYFAFDFHVNQNNCIRGPGEREGDALVPKDDLYIPKSLL